MKVFPHLLLLAGLGCHSAQSAECLFTTPLLTGASISAGYGTTPGGPASVMARMLNSSAEISVQAISGATSITILSRLKPQDPSVIMGLDLFFWDAAKNQCGGPFVRSTEAFFKKYQAKKIPLIIGRIPVGVPFPDGIRLAGQRPCAAIVNALIEKLCTLEKNCLVYDAKDCIDEMESADGYFSDALHTTVEGNKFCAKQFVAQEAYKKLRCAP